MGNGKMKTTVTTLIIVVAMTGLAIAISSNAWMNLKDNRNESSYDDLQLRFGLWDFCLCDDIVEDISSGDGFGEGFSSEEDEDTPTWYRVSQGCAVLSQILLIFTAIFLVYFRSSDGTGILILRIALGICSVIAIFATVALFGDQFRKNEFETPESQELSYIEPDWGMGLAIFALLLTFMCIVLHIIAYNFRNKDEEPSSCNLPKALNDTVRLMILLANCSMAVAIASPAWMKYVPSNGKYDTILSYGLWERCDCFPTYLLHKLFNQFFDTDDEREDTFPLWLSACQWCAILGLISMATAFLLQFVCMLNSCSKSRTLRVASIVLIGITGGLMITSIIVYRIEFRSMEVIKFLKSEELKPRMDYGIFVNMGGVCATVLAFIYGIIDLCVMSCC